MTRFLPPLVVAGLAAVAAVLLAVAPSSKPADAPVPHTAVIVDQLALTSPDPGFVSNITATLQAAGYTVDYVPSEQVTVDFYRQLPSRGYGLVIIRAHSGFVLRNSAAVTEELRGPGETFLFSSEPYVDGKYPDDQNERRLSVAFYFDLAGVEQDLDAVFQAYRDLPRYFGIKPGFIQRSTQGRFPGSTVILMGCNGLSSDLLAKAFEKKGARAVVGWDDLVTAEHTDRVTSVLLAHLLIDNLPIDTAVAQTALELGPDPSYGGALALYE